MLAKDFKIHFIRGYISDLYLAEYTDKILLLDGGSRADADKIVNFITKKLKRPINDLKLMVSTHKHPDHAGAAYIIRKKYNIPIAAYKEADQWYRGCSGRMQQNFDVLMARWVVKKKKKNPQHFKIPPILNPDILLDDNQQLPFFPDWQVIHAPGHTSHQIVLYHKQEKILYAADVILRVNGKCQLPFPVELKKFGELTLKKLSQLEIKTIILAHGGICQNINANEIFLSQIPKLNLKPKFPIYLMKIISGYNPPLKKYKKEEKYLKI